MGRVGVLERLDQRAGEFPLTNDRIFEQRELGERGRPLERGADRGSLVGFDGLDETSHGVGQCSGAARLGAVAVHGARDLDHVVVPQICNRAAIADVDHDFARLV